MRAVLLCRSEVCVCASFVVLVVCSGRSGSVAGVAWSVAGVAGGEGSSSRGGGGGLTAGVGSVDGKGG